jgi:hypothetical protein
VGAVEAGLAGALDAAGLPARSPASRLQAIALATTPRHSAAATAENFSALMVSP